MNVHGVSNSKDRIDQAAAGILGEVQNQAQIGATGRMDPTEAVEWMEGRVGSRPDPI